MSIAENTRAVVGGNAPPSQIETTQAVIAELSAWLDQTPVVEGHSAAKRAAELIKRGNIALRELDDERDAQVRPLNTAVQKINRAYKAASAPLDKIIAQIKDRLTAHARAEEARRAAEAAAARAVALAAETAAREAAEREREAIENATLGELAAGVGGAIQEAAEAEAAAARAAHAAAIATKDVPVRIGTDFGRALAMRTVETLCIDHPVAALTVLWPHPKIKDAILSAARDYRRTHGKLPRGISIHVERKI